MSSWQDRLDWREILLGVLVGVVTALLAGIVIGGLLRIPLDDLGQAVVTYLPAGFWAGYRARRGHPIANALCAGGILFLVSSVVFALADALTFPSAGLWVVQALIIAGIATVSGAIAQLLRKDMG